jgi:hypothetical protein
MNQAGIDHRTVCHHRDWTDPWDATTVMNRLTIWYPPPEIAAQLLYFLLQCHVERPLTTTALILLPRVIQKKVVAPESVGCQSRILPTRRSTHGPPIPAHNPPCITTNLFARPFSFCPQVGPAPPIRLAVVSLTTGGTCVRGA